MYSSSLLVFPHNITDCNQLVTAHGCELRLYLVLSLYMIPLYTDLGLDIFHCNDILYLYLPHFTEIFERRHNWCVMSFYTTTLNMTCCKNT